jgi:hypothetical protein
MSTTTSLMGLTVPQLGDPSPAYVDAIAASLDLLDAHNHASSGAPVPAAGLNINASLPFNNHSAKTLRSAQFAVQVALLSASADNNSLFVYGGDLYFLDGNNLPVQMTSGGQVAGAGASGFKGDYVSANASVYFYASNLAYLVQDHIGNQAPMECGGIWIDDNSATPAGGMLRLASVSNTIMEARSLPVGDQGFIYYDSANNRIRAFVGGAWKTVTVA